MENKEDIINVVNSNRIFSIKILDKINNIELNENDYILFRTFLSQAGHSRN